MDLTTDEHKLVEYAKQGVAKYNRQRRAKGDLDTLFSFLVTEGGTFYDGAAFEPNISHATVCGERHAIANLVLNEGYGAKIASIVVADPVPSVQEKSTPPCGTCRHLIWQFGKPDTSVILMQYIKDADGKSEWTFPKMEKHLIKDLYPYPYEPNSRLWD